MDPLKFNTQTVFWNVLNTEVSSFQRVANETHTKVAY